MRIQHKREFYIGEGARKIAHKHSSAVVYASERGEWLYLVGFHGRAEKPDFNYRYPNTEDGEARRMDRANTHFAQWQRAEERRAAKRAEKAAWQHDYKPGDVFSTCWGYEQTNREFWQCVEVRGKHLIVREIAAEYQETGWLQGKAVPMVDQFKSEPHRVLAQRYGFRDPRYKNIASRMEPAAMIGGKPVYSAQWESSYH